MPNYTYPVVAPEGNLPASQVHSLLARPSLIAARLANLAAQRFIADFLLQGRFKAEGGGIFYETGEEIFAPDDPEVIAPGGEYPLTTMGGGDLAAARVAKWGLDSLITDEAIARLQMSPVNKALGRIVNSIIRTVDGVAMSVIASRVSSTFTAPAAFESAGAIVTALETVRGERAELGTGLDLDTVVLKPAAYAKVLGMLIDDKALPREQGNVAVTGSLPVDALGYTWATTPHFTGSNPLFVDRDTLGGMAEEDLKSPGYARAANGVGVEVKSMRDDDNDQWRVRGRRVTVPVVLDPLAGVQLTGTGL